MKIALLSFHNAANYGAALQAFALQNTLEKEGFDCEYIDYQNERRRRGYDMGFQIKESIMCHHYSEAVKYLLGTPFLNSRKHFFSQFYKQYVKYSTRIYYSTDDLKETNEQYDCFITGSDQIWNPEHNGSDLNFLLDFVDDNSKKVSYASSLSVTAIPGELQEGYKRCFNDFRFLSTRELSGSRIIKDLTGRDAKIVLDPVFLIKANEWKELISSLPHLVEEPYLFSYTNRNDQIAKFLNTGYDMSHLKHHKVSRFTSVSDFMNPKVRVKYFMSPIEFLQNIDNAKMVVSASFHCISFCIILNKPFVCFLTGDEGKDERLKTLLSTFGLLNRIYSNEMKREDVLSPIDFITVNQVLEEKRKDSMDFLLSSIKEVESR